MAAWGNEFYLPRAESISHSFASLTPERYFQHSKIKFVSPRGLVISSIYTVKNNHVFVPVVLCAVIPHSFFRLKELFQVKNGLTTSLLLFF